MTPKACGAYTDKTLKHASQWFKQAQLDWFKIHIVETIQSLFPSFAECQELETTIQRMSPFKEHDNANITCLAS